MWHVCGLQKPITALWERMRNFAQSTVLPTAFGSLYQAATKWQRIRDQIDAAFVFTGTNFVSVHFLRDKCRIPG